MPSLSNLKENSFFNLPFKKKRSYTINPPDDDYNVTYLGNVLTIIGKGSASIEKPLNLIWKTFCQKGQRCDMPMKLSVTRSGLKAETKQQGLTEYLPHRITYCIAPSSYPRLFCWVYKHEGKKMKPELRCHAVLCKKSSEPMLISNRLTDFLQTALREYKREKLSMEKARKNAITNGPCPKRKLILQTGSLNFRPTISKNKALPRLGSIDEEEEDIEKKLNSIRQDELIEMKSQRLCSIDETKNDGSVYFDDEIEEDYNEGAFSKSCPDYCIPSTSESVGEKNKVNDRLKRNFSLTKSIKETHKESLTKLLQKQKTINVLSSSLNNLTLKEDNNYHKNEEVIFYNPQLSPSSSISLENEELIEDKKYPDCEHIMEDNNFQILLEEDDLSSYEQSRIPSVDFESSTSSCSSIDDGFGGSDASCIKTSTIKIDLSEGMLNKDKDVDCISDESGYHEETFRRIYQERDKIVKKNTLHKVDLNVKKGSTNEKYLDYEVSDI
uniref:PID domain-containing protein n=1 Tax=Parastrongyloides trichosuri TaxID=131310 RepID=A0A0N4ZRY2_PARTI